MVRHNNVAKYIHWLLCGKYEFQREDSCGGSIALNVLLRMNMSKFYGTLTSTHVDHFITARRPNIIVIDKYFTYVID